MADEPRSFHIQRKLGYCVVKWEIENFWRSTCRGGCMLNSPAFYVIGEEKTKWRFTLNTQVKESNASCVTFHIERLESNPGPDLVRANWSFSLQDIKGKIIREIQGEYIRNFGIRFGRECSNPVNMEFVANVMKNLLPFDSDSLIVECRIIVHVEDFGNKFESTIPTRSLSKDLKDLYSRAYDDRVPHSSIKSDITIEIKHNRVFKNIEGHAVILQARNAMFKRILMDAKQNSVIRIHNVDYESTKNLVSYLYSGNMDFVLQNPSIKLFRTLKFFEATELLNYYQPDVLTLSTVIGVKDERFRWSITDFSLRKEHCILSPVLGKGISNITWQLCLYPNGRDLDGKYVDISARIVEGRQPLDVWLDFVIVNKEERHICGIRVNIFMEGPEVLGAVRFTERDTLNWDVLDNDTLHIIFRVRIGSDKQNRSSVIHTSRVFSNVTDKLSDTLSRDIERMLCDNCFTDFYFVVDGNRYSCHKCILSARSKYFSQMFARQVDIESFDILGIDLNTFNILMSYIYSGNLECNEIGDNILSLSQVYDAAQMFDIYNFNDDFVKLWQTNLEVKNVCAVLLFADEKEKMELKNSALQFIVLNVEMVRSHRSWDTLAVAKPTLISEIIAFVSHQE